MVRRAAALLGIAIAGLIAPPAHSDTARAAAGDTARAAAGDTARAAAGGAPRFSVELELDRSEALLHEQVLLLMKITHPLSSRPRWEAPLFEGFWVERLNTEGGPLFDGADGQPARTTTFRRALLPSRVGDLEVRESVVVWELSGTRDGAMLRLTHRGHETFPQDDGVSNRASGVAGWRYFICEALPAFLEEG